MTTLYGFLHLSIKPSILTMLGEVELGNGMEMWIKLCEYHEKDDVMKLEKGYRGEE